MAKRPAKGSDAISKAGFLPRLFTQQLPRVKPFSEMGVAGVPVYAGYVLSPERNPRLVGQERYRTFSDILANTSIVAAGVRYFLNIVARPSWSVEPADDSDAAKKSAEWLEDVLYDGMHTPWSRIIRRCGMYRFHGFSISEWTAERRDDGTVGFSDIESRPQWTIWRWEVDERGTVIGAWQRDPLTGRELGLPRGKIMYLVDDTLTDSPEGMGLLRHLVEPSERLKEYLDQESTGYMRDLRGIPMGWAPMDELNAAVAAGQMTKAEMNAAIDSLQEFVNIAKKGRKTSLVLNSQPYISRTETGDVITSQKKWGMDLVSGQAPGLAEVSKAIDRLNYDMARIIGCEHLLLGSSSAGSFALAKEKASDLYLLANSVLRDIRLQAQHDLVQPLWSLNGFPDELMPKLKSEDVSPKDAEQIARVMRDIATAGAPMPPDDEAINFVRDLLGAPHLDINKYMDQMMMQQPINTVGGAKATMQEDKSDALEQQQENGGNIQKRDDDMEKTIRELKKVIGSTAGDYIDDFVHSGNKKFKGKSKQERINMALAAYYSKVVPYAEAEPYRDEDASITPTAVNHPSARMTSYEGSAANDAKPSGPSARSVHEGRAEASATGGKSDPTSDVLVPGSGLKTRGRRRVV